ncbi:MAG TPA: trehalase-like domain-containing protein, partial [Burkholderiales bacterium]|nr:trehalase-like domain-containing protein [Burkholderiales bacterium]
MSGLDLALIGNSSVAALLDARARIVWCCLPRFDSDPAFCALLRPDNGPEDRAGVFEVDLADFERSEQAYIAHTPILRTRLYDRHGGGIEITDFAPRFQQFGRLFYPVMLVRQ